MIRKNKKNLELAFFFNLVLLAVILSIGFYCLVVLPITEPDFFMPQMAVSERTAIEVSKLFWC